MELTIAWLYPKLMSIYGDYGNVLALQKRALWRDITVKIISVDFDNTKDLEQADLILMGGGQDRQQTICALDLIQHKKTILEHKLEQGVPGLFACGGYQLMGHFYHPLSTAELEQFNPITFEKTLSTFSSQAGQGADVPGVGIFPQYTIHYGQTKRRCTGNISLQLHQSLIKEITAIDPDSPTKTLVGFENHGGRTFDWPEVERESIIAQPLGQVIKGFGNNADDQKEGIVLNHFIGTYLHGLLIKNPHLADWLIYHSLKTKYKDDIKLKPLNDTLEWQTHQNFLKRILLK